MKKFSKKSIRSAVKALSAGSVVPMCKDHHSEYRLVPGTGLITENGYTVEISCPNCVFLGYMHPRGFENMVNGKWDDTEVIDILKKK